MAKKISEVFGVSENDLKNEGVFNGFLEIDSKLYVDPHLLGQARIPELINSYQHFKDHFSGIVHLLKTTKYAGDEFFRAAHRKLIFPELKFVSLGYSSEGNPGHGIGEKLALNLTRTAYKIVQAGITDPVLFELVGLIEEGIGADLISDMTIHIIILDLLSYSQRVVQNLGLNSRKVKARGQEFLLPASPKDRRPLVLMPFEILNDLPIANGWDDIERVCAHNDELRNRVNAIIGDSFKDANGKKRRITKQELKYLLLNNPEILQELIKQYKKHPAIQYDFDKDPAGYLIWKEIAKNYTETYPLLLDVENVTSENILSIVLKICNHFKELVENNGLCIHLWDENKSLRNERFAQLLFFGIADAYCNAHNLDLSREPNAGRGPVDFKVSRGYHARVNVEIKYTSNNIRSGYEKQLPIYNSSERTEYSIFLIIRTTKLVQGLEDLIEFKKHAMRGGKRAPEIFVVDGRIKPSASKAK